MTYFVPHSIAPSSSENVLWSSMRISTALIEKVDQGSGMTVADIAGIVGEHGLLAAKVLQEVFSGEIGCEQFLEEGKSVRLASSKLMQSPISTSADPSETDNKVIADIAAVLRRLFLYLTKGLEKITAALESRIQILDDVRATQAALDNIKASKEAPYDPSVFDVEVPLDKASPMHGKSLWTVLVHYGLRKDGDSRPTTTAELDALIGNVKSKGESASAETSRTNQKVTMLNRTRENYISLLSELVMGESKLMRSIISLI